MDGWKEERKNMCCVCSSCYSNLAVNSSKWFPSISASSTNAKSAATKESENDKERVESEVKKRRGWGREDERRGRGRKMR